MKSERLGDVVGNRASIDARMSDIGLTDGQPTYGSFADQFSSDTAKKGIHYYTVVMAFGKIPQKKLLSREKLPWVKNSNKMHTKCHSSSFDARARGEKNNIGILQSFHKRQ